MLEPQRGPLTHVSEIVVAVHDGGFGLVELRWSPDIDFPQPDVNGPGDVLVVVFLFWQNLDDDLGTAVDQGTKFVSLDALNYQMTSSFLLPIWSPLISLFPFHCLPTCPEEPEQSVRHTTLLVSPRRHSDHPRGRGPPWEAARDQASRHSCYRSLDLMSNHPGAHA